VVKEGHLANLDLPLLVENHNKASARLLNGV
jgi:hypothetical protein